MTEFLTANSLSLITLLATAGFLWRVRIRKQRKIPGSTRTSSLQQLRSSGTCWGVMIKPGKCAAVQPYRNKKFQFHNAPVIPVAGCKAWRCSCAYVGLRERRRQNRRQAHDRRGEIRFDAAHPERRSHKNRRRGEHNWIDADR